MGEIALRVSRRRLAAFPRMRGCSVLMDNLGRCGGGRGGSIIGSDEVVAMVMVSIGGRDTVDSIAWVGERDGYGPGE